MTALCGGCCWISSSRDGEGNCVEGEAAMVRFSVSAALPPHVSPAGGLSVPGLTPADTHRPFNRPLSCHRRRQHLLLETLRQRRIVNRVTHGLPSIACRTPAASFLRIIEIFVEEETEAAVAIGGGMPSDRRYTGENQPRRVHIALITALQRALRCSEGSRRPDEFAGVVDYCADVQRCCGGRASDR